MYKNNLVWKNIVDNKYFCFVERVFAKNGNLRIVNLENNALILNIDVNISFDAELNPEIEDVLLWQEICELEISKQKK